MILMQYRFELPADYDMDIIRRRVRDKGHLFDHVVGLNAKAFLCTARDDVATGSKVNVYAPFYVWQTPSAMMDFLCGDKFAGVTNSFGWPGVQSWLACQTVAQGNFVQAQYATQTVDVIDAFVSLSALREEELVAANTALQRGAMLAVSGIDPKTWQRVRFCLWPDAAALNDTAALPHTTTYNVLHTSASSGCLPFGANSTSSTSSTSP